MPELGNRRATDNLEFGSNIMQWNVCVVRMLRPRLLVEARQRRAVSPREYQSAVGKDPLRIDNVAEHLFDAPLARFISSVAHRFGDRPEPGHSGIELLLKKIQSIVPRNLADVIGVGFGVLAALWSDWNCFRHD